MAIYHLSVKVIQRSAGRSAVAAAAYRSASRLHDERLGRDHDFRAKAGVVHSEILLPEGAPERWRDRETLWNEVEARERRHDAQLAREVEISRPLVHMHLKKLQDAGLVKGELELSDSGRAMRFLEVTPFALRLTPASLAEAAKTISPPDRAGKEKE